MSSLLALPLVVLLAAPGAGGNDDLDDALDFALQQLTHAASYLATDEHAHSTLPDGTWKGLDASSWTSGFFSGCQWFALEETRSAFWLQRARAQTADLAGQQYSTSDHDIGFRILSSFGNGYRLTKDPAYLVVILNSAQSLSTRFDPVVGCIRSWDWGGWAYPVIVDNLMNLELLLWAADNGGPAWFRDMAISHALRTREEHLRPDGSTFHVVDFDPSTGAVLSRGTFQGASDGSTWARGQAWALYGFTMVHRYTDDPRFLEAAERAARYFVEHLPADRVPYWDFAAPGIPDEPRDSSASAIAAAGLLELASRTADPRLEARYQEVASEILHSLSSPAYLAEGTISDGVLLHAVGHAPANVDVDVSLVYGDYYFLEAIRRYRGKLP